MQLLANATNELDSNTLIIDQQLARVEHNTRWFIQMRWIAVGVPEAPLLSPFHLGPMLAVLPLMLMAIRNALRTTPIIPIHDPFLVESLQLHQ